MSDITPFSFVEAASYTKEDIIRGGDATEKDYNAYIINRSLSYFPDSVFDAQEMNREHTLDPLMQFDYLRLSLRKRKRFSPWSKKTNADELKVISEAFNMNINKSREALRALTEKELIDIRSSLNRGGWNEGRK
jgi:hypothetical protein